MKKTIGSKKNKGKVKRKIKDSVFIDLFSYKKYSLELYKALHPEDENILKKDIKIITLKAIIVNDIYNDFGMIIKDKIIFLLEAQSTWSINILVRIFLYLAYAYKNYFNKNNVNLYTSKKVYMPLPELYVIYTGEKKINKKVISLNDEFFDNKAPIDLKVKVVTNSKKEDIIYQYIEFSKITDNYVKRYGYKKSTIEKIIKECIRRNILVDYLNERREEVVDIMGILFDQDTVTKYYEKELKAEAREEGEIDAFVKMYKQGYIKAGDAARMLNKTVNEFLTLAK